MGPLGVEYEGWTEFPPMADRAAPRDFLKAKCKGNPEEEPCQPQLTRRQLLDI